MLLNRSDYGSSELVAVPFRRRYERRRQEVDISVSRERVSDITLAAAAAAVLFRHWCCSEKRLGKRGAKDIKGHSFFRQNQWTWDDIRNCECSVTVPLVLSFVSLCVSSVPPECVTVLQFVMVAIGIINLSLLCPLSLLLYVCH